MNLFFSILSSTLSINPAKTYEIWVAKLYFERQTEAALYYCWKMHDNIEKHGRTNASFLGIQKTLIEVKIQTDLDLQEVKGSHPSAIATFLVTHFYVLTRYSHLCATVFILDVNHML